MGYSKIVAASVLSAALALSMVGCAGGSQGGSAEEQTSAKEAPAEKTASQKAAEAYRGVLEEPLQHFSVDEALASEAMFSYALVVMQEGDVPQMLVRASGPAESWNGIEMTRVFSYDAASDTLIAPHTDITSGVAGAGGYRGGLSCSAYGNGLLLSELSSGTGEGEISRITIEGTDLSKAIIAPISMRTDSAVSHVFDAEMREIAWADVADASAIDDLEAGQWQSVALEQAPDRTAEVQQAGLSVYTGTVRVLDEAAMVEFQGAPNPNPSIPGDPGYIVLDLGSEQELTFHSGSGPDMFTNSGSMLLLDRGDANGSWGAYDGKQITVAVDPTRTFWPSDTSMPLGVARCKGLVAVIG